jgi:hypothetical protein
MNKVQIKNVGSTETIYKENNKSPKRSSLKWSGNYDGTVAKINVSINDNGKMKKSKINLTNDELMNIFSQPVDTTPIDERLFNDILSPMNESRQIMPLSSQMMLIPDNIRGSKSRSYSNKSKKKRNNKTKKRRNKVNSKNR